MLFPNKILNTLASEQVFEMFKDEIIKIENHKGSWEPTVTLPNKDKTTLDELVELSKSMHNVEDSNLRFIFISAANELFDEGKISEDLSNDIKVAFIEKPWMKS